MDGIHDMGGTHGWGTVTIPPDEPVFAEPWEAKAFAFGALSARLSGRNLDAMRHAIERSRATLASQAELDALRERYASLSCRERDVMALVVCGRLNKQCGAELGISEITVKAHRGKMMRKMGAHSLPELVNIAAKLFPTA